MNNKKNYKKGTRNLVVRTILSCGAFPREALEVSDKSVRTGKAATRMMVKEGVLKDTRVVVDRHVHHVLTLGDYSANKEVFQRSVGDRFCEAYESYGYNMSRTIRFSKGKYQKTALRELLSIDAQLFAQFSGAETTIGEAKHLLMADSLQDGPLYYTSKEIKRFKEHRADVAEPLASAEQKTRHRYLAVSETRMKGALFSPGGNYIVYNFGEAMRDITLLGEKRIKAEVAEMLASEGASIEIDGITIVKSLDVMMDMLMDAKQKRNYSIFEDVFPCNYVVPFSQEGRMHFEMMQKRDWRDVIIAKYFPRFNASGPSGLPGVDLILGDNYVNAFMFPDVLRLAKFVETASKSPGKYTVCCFDYQKPFVQAVAGRHCGVKTVRVSSAREIFKE